MRSRTTSRVLSLALVGALAACGAPPADLGDGQPADTLIINGNVVTMDPARPRAEAVAIVGDRIVAVGSTAELDALRGDATRLIDVEGRTVIPGLVDGHLHFANLAGGGELDLGEARSEAEAAELVRRRASRTQPGEWITGGNWHTGNWETEAWPSRQSLDAAAPDNPVILRGMHGHASWGNSEAFRLAGVTRVTPDPLGGRILKAPDTGFPTGVLIENAQALVRPPAASGGEPLAERVKRSVALALSQGLTGAHDMGTSLENVEAYQALIAAGEFPFRISAYLRVVNAGDELNRFLLSEPFVDPTVKLQVHGIKVSIDGALGSRGAALMTPYDDDVENLGVIRVPYDQLYMIVEKSIRSGHSLAIHAIGDRGNQMALDAVAQALTRYPTPDHRIRIEHAQVLRPEDVPRFAALGVITSWQWMHGTLDMPWAERRVGPERIRTAYAWRMLLDSGARLVGGSDEGAATFSPFMGIHAAVTRQDRDGQPEGGWYPDQRLTREEALRSYTIDAAYATFLEDELGSLTPGKLADLVVLSRDILTVPAEEILTTEAVMTMVGGEVAYERE